MLVSIIQNNPIFGEKLKNIEKLLEFIDKTNSELYLMPELCYTGYQFLNKDEALYYADDINSKFLNYFREKSKEKNSILVFGFAEKYKNKVYNSSLAILPNGKEYLYRKIHLFYKEKLIFEKGNKGFIVFEYNNIKIGLAICFDWYFPESFRTLALKGADIIAHSANLVMPYCQKANFTRAIENKVFILTANRVGYENRNGELLQFTGESVAVSPSGEYISVAPKAEEAILNFEIDPAIARNKNINKLNNIFEDRRKKFYNI